MLESKFMLLAILYISLHAYVKDTVAFHHIFGFSTFTSQIYHIFSLII